MDIGERMFARCSDHVRQEAERLSVFHQSQLDEQRDKYEAETNRLRVAVTRLSTRNTALDERNTALAEQVNALKQRLAV